MQRNSNSPSIVKLVTFCCLRTDILLLRYNEQLQTHNMIMLPLFTEVKNTVSV